MNRFKELLKKFWAMMDGNKTVAGTAIIAILSNWPLPQPYQSILLLLVGVFTGVSAKQHFIGKQMWRADRR